MNLLFASAVGIRAKCQCCRLVFQHIMRRELRSHVLEEAKWGLFLDWTMGNSKWSDLVCYWYFLLVNQSVPEGHWRSGQGSGTCCFRSTNRLGFFSGTCFLLKTDAVSHHFAIQVFVVADSSVRIRVAHWTWMSSKRLNQTPSLRHDCPIQSNSERPQQFSTIWPCIIPIHIYIYTDKLW